MVCGGVLVPRCAGDAVQIQAGKLQRTHTKEEALHAVALAFSFFHLTAAAATARPLVIRVSSNFSPSREKKTKRWGTNTSTNTQKLLRQKVILRLYGPEKGAEIFQHCATQHYLQV
jgi:hypothetical protein